MKRFWRTYVALVVFAGLGAYVYFVESKRPASDDKAKEKVFAVEKEKVKEIAVTRAEGDPLRVVKAGSGWALTAPAAAPADSTQVDSLLSTIATAEVTQVVTEQPASLSTFGLDTPRLTVTVVADGAASPLTLQIGNKTPDETSLYAKSPPQARVFTIPSYIDSTFDRKPFDLRDRSVLHVKREAIKSLEISGPEGAYSLAKNDKGDWAFVSPVKTLAGRWSVDGLLGNLENLQMDAIAAEDAKDMKPYGLDKPTRTVVIGLTDGGAKRLEIGAPKTDAKDKYYARDASRSLVSEIPQALPSDLAKGMAELRAKRLLDVAVYEVTGVDLTVDGQKRTLTRNATKDSDGIDVYKWKKTAPETKDLETNAVQDVLYQIGGVEVAEFVDKPGPSKTYGLDAPTLRVSLGQDKKPAISLDLAQKDGSVYARRDGDDAVLKLDPKATALIDGFKKL